MSAAQTLHEALQPARTGFHLLMEALGMISSWHLNWNFCLEFLAVRHQGVRLTGPSILVLMTHTSPAHLRLQFSPGSRSGVSPVRIISS